VKDEPTSPMIMTMLSIHKGMNTTAQSKETNSSTFFSNKTGNTKQRIPNRVINKQKNATQRLLKNKKNRSVKGTDEKLSMNRTP